MSITAEGYRRIEAIRKSAEEGDVEAQYRIGEIYSDPLFENIPEAIKWITKAAENGHEEAKKVLALL